MILMINNKSISAPGECGFTAISYIEDDGAVTLSLSEMDLAENAKTVAEAKIQLAGAMMEYAKDFQSDFDYWSSAPNRKDHILYVSEILKDDIASLVKKIKCIPEALKNP